MKVQIVVLSALFTFTGFASAKVESFEHPHCKLNHLVLSNGNQFGKYGFMELDNPETQEAIKILEGKGYIYDPQFIEADLNSKVRTGLFLAIRAVYTRVPELSYNIVANGANVTVIRKRESSELKQTSSMRILAEDSKRFLRSVEGKKKDFFFDYMKSIPTCLINPNVSLDITIYK